MKYDELKEIKEDWEGKVCIFGAGGTGTTWAYDLLFAAGFTIHSFCDNAKTEGLNIINDIKTISPKTLYSYQDQALVFIAVDNPLHQCSIREQLEKNGVRHIVDLSYYSVQECMEELMEMDNPSLNWQFRRLLDDKEFLCRKFERMLGYSLDLENPRSFNEKLQWLKLYDRKPEYIKLVDKCEVKKYIAGKLGEEYVIPTLGVYEKFDEIDFDRLPQQFVLKCTHDSGSVVICRDKKAFDIDAAKEMLENALKRNFYLLAREWPYKDVPRKIIAEKYLDDESNSTKELIDYKFYCFDGKAKYLYVSQGLENHATARISFLTMDWEFALFARTDYMPFEDLPQKPDCFGEMVEMAESLSKGLTFVRIDLYVVSGQIYFSEFTFTPCGGFMPVCPIEWDFELGKRIHLPGTKLR